MLYNDINLIPSRKSKLTPARIVIIILLVFTIGSYVGNYLVYEPLKQRSEEQEKLDNLNAKVASYGDIASEYVKAKEEYNEYEKKTAALKSIITDDFSALDKIKAFVKACPEDTFITSYMLIDNNLSISISSKSYEIIGEYISALEGSEHFSDIKYQTITLATKDEENESYTVTLSMKVK